MTTTPNEAGPNDINLCPFCGADCKDAVAQGAPIWGWRVLCNECATWGSAKDWSASPLTPTAVDDSPAADTGDKPDTARVDAMAAAQADYAARLRAALEPDPDALHALTAAAYEAAAKWCHVHTMDSVTQAKRAKLAGAYVVGEYSQESCMIHHGMGYAEVILALTPADALAAQARRDARMRAQGMREAHAAIAAIKADSYTTHGLVAAEAAIDAVRVMAEKEAGL